MPAGFMTEDPLAPISGYRLRDNTNYANLAGNDFVPAIQQPKFNANATPANTGMTTGQTLGAISAISSGLEATNAPQMPTADSTEGVVNTLQAGVTGALTGAAVGSVVPVIGTAVGAAVGGVTGLVFGGLKSWLNVKSTRKKQREAERLRKEAEERMERHRAEDKAFLTEQIQWNRKAMAEQEKLKLYQEGRNNVFGALQMNQDLKTRFHKLGY